MEELATDGALRNAGEVRESCEKVSAAVKDSVILSGCSGFADQYSYGLSIYFPWAVVDKEYETLTQNERRWFDFVTEYVTKTRRVGRNFDEKLGPSTDKATLNTAAGVLAKRFEQTVVPSLSLDASLETAREVLGRIAELQRDGKSCESEITTWEKARCEIIELDQNLKGLMDETHKAIETRDSEKLRKVSAEIERVAMEQGKAVQEFERSLQRYIKVAAASVGSPILRGSLESIHAGHRYGPRTMYGPRTVYGPRTAFDDESRSIDRRDRWAKNAPIGCGIAWFGIRAAN
jgi:hypothetical protein